MKSYHFSLGDSSDGPIGYCARITAATKEDAVARLQEILHASTGTCWEVEIHSTKDEYVAIYLNSDAVSVANIDEVNEE